MKKNIILAIFVTTLVFSGFSLASGDIETIVKIDDEKPLLISNNDADLPTWSVGDSWTYSINVQGHLGDSTNFDLNIDNFKLEVEAVESEQYELSLSVPRGDVTGGGTVDLDVIQLSGSLIQTMMDGTFFVRKDTLAIANSEVEIDGAVDKIVDIPFNVNIVSNFFDDSLNQTEFLPLQFPLNIGDSWLTQGTYIISDLIVSLLPDPSVLYFYINMHSLECIGWETIEIGSNSFDALKVSGDFGDKNDIWFSPAAGNIIKLDYENIDLSYGYILDELVMTLESTTYQADSNPPEKPTTPTGLANIEVGGSATYSSSSSDPDDDIIKLIFDWGDGTKSYSDFIESGETVEIQHNWGSAGTFQVKVKARDKFGVESDWSDPLEVTVTNNAPQTPSAPTGPTSGKIKKTYTYTASTTDEDNHQIYYRFDWGDGSNSGWLGPYDSGEEASSSKKWTSQGSFEVKVKAKDEYNMESDWSESLSVSMPKEKSRGSIIIKFLDRLSYIINRLVQNLPMDLLH